MSAAMPSIVFGSVMKTGMPRARNRSICVGVV